jgi:GntR family transcriptional regulator
MTTTTQSWPVLDAMPALPLYHQLAETLLAQIRAGDYLPGQRIPSEHVLAERFGVGRPTVRQATDALIQRGLLKRRRGSGTFVRSVPAQVDLFSLAGTLVSFEERGIALSSELCGRPRKTRVCEVGHPLDGRDCTHIVRLSRVDGRPVLLEEFDFDAEHFPGIVRLSLKQRSISTLVQEHFALRLQSADQTFRCAPLDAPRARLLELAGGTPILRVDRTLNFALAPAGAFARMYCRTDRFAFSQRIGGNING